MILSDKHKTEQSHKDKCDIKCIMRKYRKTGVLPIGNKSPLYGDFTGATSYHEACNLVLQASNDFDALPAEIRKRFRNDPKMLMDFLENPANREEAIELGIVAKPENSGKMESETISNPASQPPEGPQEPTGSN